MVLTYSYMKQRSATREWLFRKRLLVESTFALTMCQPWEKAIAWTLIVITCALCLSTGWGLVFHLPRYINNRVHFYLLGDGQLSS